MQVKSKKSAVLLTIVAILALGAFVLVRWVTAPQPPSVVYDGLDPAIVQVLDDCYAAVRWSPRSGEAWGRLGIALMNYKFIAEAQDCLREAEKRDPRNPRWPYFLSLSMFPDNIEDGLPKLKRAVELDGNSDPAPRNRLATILAELGEYEESRSQFKQVLQKWPDDPMAILGLGKIAFAQNQLEESLDHLNRVIGSRHAATSSRQLLKTIHERHGNAAEAARIARELNTLPEDIPPRDPYELEASELYAGRVAWLDNAARLYRQGRYADAMPIVQRCVRDYPESVDARILLARLQMRRRDYEAARATWESARRLSPDAVEVLVQLGVTLLYLESVDSAIECFESAIEIDQTLSEAHHNLGLSYIAAKNFNAAVSAFQTAVQLKPGFVDSHLGLADALNRTGNLSDARDALQKAYQLDPNDQRTLTMRRRLGIE